MVLSVRHHCASPARRCSLPDTSNNGALGKTSLCSPARRCSLPDTSNGALGKTSFVFADALYQTPVMVLSVRHHCVRQHADALYQTPVMVFSVRHHCVRQHADALYQTPVMVLSVRHHLGGGGGVGTRKCSLADTSQTTHCQIITTPTTTTRRSQQPPPQINVFGQEHQADGEGEVPQLHHKGHTIGNGHAPAPSVRALHEKHSRWWDLRKRVT